jgi:hypothetical protein
LIFQEPVIKEPDNELWTITFVRGNCSDWGESIKQTSDGGYIITGWAYHTGADTGDVGLLKIDINGNVEWNKTYGGKWEHNALDVITTSDGGFLITGYYGYGSAGPIAVWLIKTDDNGDLIWEKKYSGENDHEFGMRVLELDNGYLVMAETFFDHHMWMIKTDYDGNILWDRYIDEDYFDRCKSLFKTSNGDIILVGEHGIDEEMLLIKIDTYGNILWRRTYEQINSCNGDDIFEDIDGGYVIVGEISGNIRILKVNIDGDINWIKSYDLGGYDNVRFGSMDVDNGFILCGNIWKPETGNNGFILKTDNNGIRLWQKKTDTTGSDSLGFNEIIASNDDTYVVVSSLYSYTSGKTVIFVSKYDRFNNNRPDNPDGPYGNTSGQTYVFYDYSTSSIDPDVHNVSFYFDWGDGTGNWSDYVSSGNMVNFSHSWSDRGSYSIMVKSMDEYGAESDYSILNIQMPKNKPSINLFDWLLDSLNIQRWR